MIFRVFRASIRLEKIGMALEKKVDGIGGDNYPTLIYSTNERSA
jgi:hypothetical protein